MKITSEPERGSSQQKKKKIKYVRAHACGNLKLIRIILMLF